MIPGVWIVEEQFRFAVVLQCFFLGGNKQQGAQRKLARGRIVFPQVHTAFAELIHSKSFPDLNRRKLKL